MRPLSKGGSRQIAGRILQNLSPDFVNGSHVILCLVSPAPASQGAVSPCPEDPRYPLGRRPSPAPAKPDLRVPFPLPFATVPTCPSVPARCLATGRWRPGCSHPSEARSVPAEHPALVCGGLELPTLAPAGAPALPALPTSSFRSRFWVPACRTVPHPGIQLLTTSLPLLRTSLAVSASGAHSPALSQLRDDLGTFLWLSVTRRPSRRGCGDNRKRGMPRHSRR